MKSQEVRLVDVLVLGPFLIWASQQRRLTPATQSLLLISGVATVLYNARNYLRKL